MNPARRRILLAGTAAMVIAPAARAQAFDQGHAAWTALLKKHVLLLRGGQASQVRYAGFAADRGALKAYLDALSAVPAAALQAWSKPQQHGLRIAL